MHKANSSEILDKVLWTNGIKVILYKNNEKAKVLRNKLPANYPKHTNSSVQHRTLLLGGFSNVSNNNNELKVYRNIVSVNLKKDKTKLPERSFIMLHDNDLKHTKKLQKNLSGRNAVLKSKRLVSKY